MAARQPAGPLSDFTPRRGTADDVGVKHTIRHTMLTLGVGIVVQRLCQLAAFVLAGRALGVAGLGVLAQGQAVAAMLTVLSGAGVGNIAARRLAAAPGSLRAAALAAMRQRFTRGLVLAAVVGALAAGSSDRPLFWWLCALQVLPAACDLKPLLDAAGRTRRDVGLETVVAGLQLAAMAWATLAAAPRLETLAAILLGCRLLHAAGAALAIARLPRGDVVASAGTPVRLPVAIGQLAHELLAIGDIWLVAVALGDAAAGCYAVGVRLAAAALLPSAQLTRLLFPHVLHANHGGDATRALGTALRATLLVTLPVCAGGLAASAALVRLFGHGFADAQVVLVLLLAAGSLQHLGWQCSSTLLAAYRDRAYAHAFGWPALAQAAAIGLLPQFLWLGPGACAQLAALVAVAAQGAYATTALALTRAVWRAHTGTWWHAAALAAVVGIATSAPLAVCDPTLHLPLQLAVGGIAFAGGLWWCELRGRWRRVGDGLAAASGFTR